MAKQKISNSEWIRQNFPNVMNGTASSGTLSWVSRKLEDEEAKEAARRIFSSSSMTEEQKFQNNYPHIAKIIGV